MARYRRIETLQAMYDQGLCALFYHNDPEIAGEVAAACICGGARVLEFTNRGDLAYQVFAQLAQYCKEQLPEVILGVGSVLDEGTASLYINCGANFVVSPVLNEQVARVCNRRKIPYIPGCATLSEISRAEELGCEIIKVFPGSAAGGPSFVKAVLGPCPWTSLMPTGGVDITEENLSSWFEAGVACVGIGSKLISKDLVACRDYVALAERVRGTLSNIAKCRKAL